MTRAKRLDNLLKDIKSKETKSLLTIWKEIFEVSNIFEVYEHLIYVKQEIDAFELEIKQFNMADNTQFKNIISTLNTIVNFPSLNAPIQNQAIMKNEVINIVFASFEIYQTLVQAQHLLAEIEDDIPTDEFESFKKNIETIIKDVESSDIVDSDKSIFLSIFYDLNKAVALYQVNGINAFTEVIRNNLCKINMINITEEDNSDIDKYKNFTKKAIGIVWIWGIKYVKKRVIGAIESKAFQFLDENASEWAKLPMLNIDDIEAEIEEETD